MNPDASPWGTRCVDCDELLGGPFDVYQRAVISPERTIWPLCRVCCEAYASHPVDLP